MNMKNKWIEWWEEETGKKQVFWRPVRKPKKRRVRSKKFRLRNSAAGQPEEKTDWKECVEKTATDQEIQ